MERNPDGMDWIKAKLEAVHDDVKETKERLGGYSKRIRKNELDIAVLEERVGNRKKERMVDYMVSAVMATVAGVAAFFGGQK